MECEGNPVKLRKYNDSNCTLVTEHSFGNQGSAGTYSLLKAPISTALKGRSFSCAVTALSLSSRGVPLGRTRDLLSPIFPQPV